MHDEYALLVFLSVGLVAALVLGLVTERLKLSPIVGYLLAGIIVSPNTPGFDADPHLAVQLAEIGVVLLMFGVGLHFNLCELWAVRQIALPGAIGQIAVATALGALVTCALGWKLSEGLIVGIAISVASTVVLIRVLMDNVVLHTPAVTSLPHAAMPRHGPTTKARPLRCRRIARSRPKRSPRLNRSQPTVVGQLVIRVQMAAP